jgi:glycosyltransferase involved in cell wall biosynthesis
VRVVRVYHGGRNHDHRARDRALAAAGVDVTLVVPAAWPEPAVESELTDEPFSVVELPVRRSGDVNRHVYADGSALTALLRRLAPDLLDLHEEPFSAAGAQWRRAAPKGIPMTMYTAQNIDKRFPPPFAGYERAAYARASGVYAVSRQAAAVVRGKGFGGPIEVLPLGFDESLYLSGAQSASDAEIVLGFVGRFVPEKGLRTAIEVLAAVARTRPCRLLAVGSGPEERAARELAASRGVTDNVEFLPWQPPNALAEAYRGLHVLLVPSTATGAWAEQFGRVVVEAQAAGAVVAAYASGAIPEVAGPPAVLVAEGDAEGLGARVAAVLADPDDYERRRSTGLELAAGRTWAKVAERQAAFYERARDVAPRAPAGRAAARREFGPTATTPLGLRPPALPGIRRLMPLIALARRATSRRARTAAPPSAPA